MDTIFRRGKFWVDSIFDVGNEYANARIIPDIKSEYFPPWHTRTIGFPTHYLESRFYDAKMRSDESLEPQRMEFTGAVVQGQYYNIPDISRRVRKTRSGIYDLSDTDLNSAKEDSPYTDDIKWEPRKPEDLGSARKRGKEECRLYCFNVGQGDSSLLVVNGNVYLIDTNIYAGKVLDKFIDKLKEIMHLENIEPRIKALIITHKHSDHLRGAHKLLASNRIKIDGLFMNYLYQHPIPTVRKFLDAVEDHIPSEGRIDASEPFKVTEGVFELNFLNPTRETNTKQGASDINDSSIVFTVRDTRRLDGNQFVLTGDASFPILEDTLTDSTASQSFLKVAHHGSRTGTSINLVQITNPEYASISAGKSKNNHPHIESLNILNLKLSSNDIFISKNHKKTVKCDLATLNCVLI